MKGEKMSWPSFKTLPSSFGSPGIVESLWRWQLEDGDGFIIVNLKDLYMYLCVSRSNVYGKNEDQVQQSLLTKYPSWLRHPCPPDKIVCPLQKQSSTREHEKRSTWSWKQSSRFLLNREYSTAGTRLSKNNLVFSSVTLWQTWLYFQVGRHSCVEQPGRYLFPTPTRGDDTSRVTHTDSSRLGLGTKSF